MRSSASRIAVVLGVTLLAACGGDTGAPQGSEGGPCYANDTCDGELLCLSGICVTPPGCLLDSTQPCSCGDGTTGTQICLADETWGQCQCGDRCGNGALDAGESCDGSALGGADCRSEGFAGGELGCTETCTYDTSACHQCGNSAIDAGEQCDGTALGGADCQSEGFVGGNLTCTGACTLDTAGCHHCGNGTVDSGEQCDGLDLDGADCQSEGFVTGTLACDAQCAVDTSGCAMCSETVSPAPPRPLSMIVLLDRSGSMGTKWSQSVTALTSFFNDPGSDGIEVAMSFFPVAGFADTCNPPHYVTPHVPMVTLPTGAPTLVSAMNAQSADGPNTPTYGALLGTLQNATAYQDINPNHKVIVVLATDGSSTSCPGNQNETASIAGLAASAYGYNGVETYVIALQGSVVADLNQIAAAGGTSAAINVTSDITLLTQAMTGIRDSMSTCEYEATAAVQNDPALVNLYFTAAGGTPQLVPQADSLNDCGATPGWYYDDPFDPAMIHLCPATCTAVTSDPSPSVDIGVGCATISN